MGSSSFKQIPRLLAISDLGSQWRRSLETWLLPLINHGVDAIQIREKSLCDTDLLALISRAVELSAGRLEILVNSRADLAMAGGADGVHLPISGLPPQILRRRWPKLRLGLSTHHPEEVAAAVGNVDYVTFGPVYTTPSKARFGSPVGLRALAEACRFEVPVLALGGVTAERLEEVATAGASGAGAIRALHDPDSLLEIATRAAAVWPPPVLASKV